MRDRYGYIHGAHPAAWRTAVKALNELHARFGYKVVSKCKCCVSQSNEMIIARAFTPLYEENQRLQGLYDDAMARLEAFHTPGSIGEENRRLRELLQHWYDYGYDRRENERALEEGE